METYAVFRRHGWQTPDAFREATARSTVVSEAMAEKVRWLRSYVTAETDGSLGTVCIYEASDPEALRAHAQCADLPVVEILKVTERLIVRPDPVAEGS